MSTNGFVLADIACCSFSYGFTGNIKEIIISSPNSDSDHQKIESYLAQGHISNNLPASHPYHLGAPTLASGTPEYVTDTWLG